MPRVTHTPISLPGQYATLGQTLTMVAADATNKEQVAATGKEIIIAHNTGVTGQTVTVTSSGDAKTGRTGDIAAFALAAGAYAVLGGPFPLDGWKQSDGKIYFEASDADVVFGVIKIP